MVPVVNGDTLVTQAARFSKQDSKLQPTSSDKNQKSQRFPTTTSSNEHEQDEHVAVPNNLTKSQRSLQLDPLLIFEH